MKLGACAVRLKQASSICTAVVVLGCSSQSEGPTSNTGSTQPLAGRVAAVGGNSSQTPLLPSTGGAPAPSAGSSASPDGTPNGPAAMGGAPAPTANADLLPCDVATVVAEKCATCHGSEPIGGAPMSLVKGGDFSRTMTSIRTSPGETEMVASLVKKRINDPAMPMPPGELLAEPQRAMLNAWLDGGRPAAAAGSTCAQPGDAAQAPKPPTATMRVDENGSLCYQFQNHGAPEPGDKSPYPVPGGEHYVSFFFKSPWQQPSELISFKTLADNRKLLHHWLLYTTIGNDMDGTFAPGIGTHIGDAAQLLAGWAVGGNDVEMPQDVALRLPPPGSGIMIEWHFYNAGGALEMDTSSVELCLAPQGTRKNTAGMTWLGTENFNGPLGMPARAMSDFGGTCLPSRTGMNDTDPIHIFTLWPHMHQYGRHMKSVISRANGTQEEVFSKPFDFNYQITYDTNLDLYPGDMITSTCTFENTSDLNVAFGPSSNQEMCYQFAYSYPAGALDNGVPSLVGATNTCW
jgi:cytochrome c5